MANSHNTGAPHWTDDKNEVTSAIEQKWQQIKEKLQEGMPKGQYDLWVSTLEFRGTKRENLLLGCRNRLHIEWLREKLENRLLELAQQHFPKVRRLEYEIIAETPLSELEDLKESGNAFQQLSFRDALGHFVPAFNRKFTFDQFVVGNCNQFAYAASMAMATGQQSFHPSIYLLSETGLGKSHLSQAVGNYLYTQKPAVRVKYVTAEQFANEMIFSLKRDCIESFKQKYRVGCDVLIMEKVEFLSGKEKIQKELVYTMDELLDRGKRILCTGNAFPRDIPRLSNELRSRLSGILVAPIERPDFATRVEIVKAKARYENISIPTDVMEFLADRITRDIRQIESCIVGMIAKSNIMGVPISLRLAEEVSRTMLDQLPKLTIEHIQQVVCASFQVSMEELKSPSRRKELATARKIGMYLCRNYTSESLASIGKAFCRAHSSVLHAVKRLGKEMEGKNNKLQRQVEHVSRRLETSCIQ